MVVALNGLHRRGALRPVHLFGLALIISVSHSTHRLTMSRALTLKWRRRAPDFPNSGAAQARERLSWLRHKFLQRFNTRDVTWPFSVLTRVAIRSILLETATKLGAFG